MEVFHATLSLDALEKQVKELNTGCAALQLDVATPLSAALCINVAVEGVAPGAEDGKAGPQIRTTIKWVGEVANEVREAIGSVCHGMRDAA
jgi:hypothetical protein